MLASHPGISQNGICTHADLTARAANPRTDDTKSATPANVPGEGGTDTGGTGATGRAGRSGERSADGAGIIGAAAGVAQGAVAQPSGAHGGGIGEGGGDAANAEGSG